MCILWNISCIPTMFSTWSTQVDLTTFTRAAFRHAHLILFCLLRASITDFYFVIDINLPVLFLCHGAAGRPTLNWRKLNRTAICRFFHCDNLLIFSKSIVLRFFMCKTDWTDQEKKSIYWKLNTQHVHIFSMYYVYMYFAVCRYVCIFIFNLVK